MTRQSGTEWSKSCHMFQSPLRLPSDQVRRTSAGSRRAFTSWARFQKTVFIGRSLRFQIAIAGNQSSGETSIASRRASAAKHFAFVTRQSSPVFFPSATSPASTFFSAGTSRPVVRSVTSWRNFRRRYVAESAIVATCGSHDVVSKADFAKTASGPAYEPVSAARRRNVLLESVSMACLF